jgi:hypothetical protein
MDLTLAGRTPNTHSFHVCPHRVTNPWPMRTQGQCSKRLQSLLDRGGWKGGSLAPDFARGHEQSHCQERPCILTISPPSLDSNSSLVQTSPLPTDSAFTSRGAPPAHAQATGNGGSMMCAKGLDLGQVQHGTPHLPYPSLKPASASCLSHICHH